jgi:hypothetical protein
MKYKQSIRFAIQIFLIASFDSSVVRIGQAQSSTRLSESSIVSIRGIGAIRIGMTVSQASRAANIKLITKNRDRQTTCLYYQPAGKPKGISFMVSNGIIVRIDISNPRITTRSGAKIGDSEEQIRSIYGSRIQTKDHKYLEQGHYLVYVPRDHQDRVHRIVFETDGSKITNWRVGQIPEVEWVEGCA